MGSQKSMSRFADQIVKSRTNDDYAIKVNDKMSEQSNRRAKAKDWASDGRRAAGMVFGALNDMSAASRSFAILLLAGTAQSRFPVFNSIFAERLSMV